MTNKEIRYGDITRQAHRKSKATRKLKKQPFPKIYANRQEDYELFETDEDQINAVMVDLDVTRLNF